MSLEREEATAFVDGYRRSWESLDMAGFVDLFTDDVVYVAHPTETTVVGRKALEPYFEWQQAEMGEISVLMGRPIVDGDRVAAEFWVTASNRDGDETTAGCLIGQLDGTDGRCTHFREYWFDIEGHVNAFNGWGE